jgi:hypothetical protein
MYRIKYKYRMKEFGLKLLLLMYVCLRVAELCEML